MSRRPRYPYITDPEDEVALVRDCLRKLAKDMQSRGEIPPDVSEAELYSEVEPRVPGFVRTLRSSPMYPHWKAAGHLEEHVRSMVKRALDIPPSDPPAVAKDQISYVHAGTGQSLSPTWKHRGCSGTVYPSDDTFKCNGCKRTGQLGADMPEGLTREQQMEFMLTQVEEVDLTDSQETTR